MADIPSYLIGGRRVARPANVDRCALCGEALGANYATCRACHAAIEDIWLADWGALLERERIQPASKDEKLLARVVTSEFGRHPWTVMDIAMSLQRCDECGRELGEGYPECAACGMAFGASIQSEFGATGNEHALHVGRWILRFPQCNSSNIVAAWRLSVPRLLTGWLPATGEAQRVMALVVAGKWEEVQAEVKRLNQFINQRR